MNRRFLLVSALALATRLAVPVASPLFADTSIPDRPEKLHYGELKFEVPDAAKLRHELPGGVVVYVVEDHSLPLVSIQATLRTGSFREPAGKTGLAALTAAMLRKGGTASLTPDAFDQRADFLAAKIETSAADTRVTASLDVLTSALDDGLALTFDMLAHPRFDAERLGVEKGNLLEGMKQRNDDADDILSREWDFLTRGETHFSVRRITQADFDAIGRDDLVAFHAKTVSPRHAVFAVSGDVDTKQILAKLAKWLATWPATSAEEAPWPPRGPDVEPRAGLFHVEKDIPQGKVGIGHLGAQWKDYGEPEMYSLMVMNRILGGGGFMSRLTKRIRSDEGLAYGAGSTFGIGAFWPGLFEVEYSSKNPTVAYAAKIALEEIDRMRREPVSAEELSIAKSSYLETFPRAFESAARVAATFATDEVTARPHSYWTAYRGRIGAVTADQIFAAAKKYLHPDRLTMLVVGKWSEIEPGDAQGRAKMADLFGGKVTHLPARDPLTLAPIQ